MTCKNEKNLLLEYHTKKINETEQIITKAYN
jgi:hypothetical protein